MTLYLDVGVTGIQAWIFRSPTLAATRGASSMLGQATDRSSWAKLPAGWEWNEDAGNVSGVVSLRRQSSEGAEHAHAGSIARHVIAQLRAALPGAALTAEWGEWESYAAFRNAAVTALQGGRGRQQPADVSTVMALQSLPAVREDPLAQPCSECQQDPASPDTAADLPAKIKDVEVANTCRDCQLRLTHADKKGATQAWALHSVWQRLQERAADKTLVAAESLSNLAALGRSRTTARADDQMTRIAVLVADGNAVGQFVQQALRRKLDKSKLAVAIGGATLDALLDATVETAFVPGADGVVSVAVLPHLVGGDDVNVSISAHLAWDFALTFMDRFERRFATYWDDSELKQVTPPTMSVGIAIHHMKSPIQTAMEEATQALHEAKTSGSGARIAWRDEFFGVPASGWLPPKTITDYRRIVDHARAIASLPAAHRAVLSQLASEILDRHAGQPDAIAEGELGGIRETARKQGTTDSIEVAMRNGGVDLAPHFRLHNLLWALQIARDVEPTADAKEGKR